MTRPGVPAGRFLARALSALLSGARRLPLRLVLSAAFLAAGVLLYPAAALMNRFLAFRYSPPPLLSVLPEEALKLGMALAAAALARRFRRPGLGLCSVLGAAAFGTAENVAYIAAFPDAAVFLRLGWALPLHVNSGALFALALASRAPGPAAAGAFAAAWAVHAAYNAAASANPSLPVILGGIVLNLALCAGLAAAAQARFAWGGILNAKHRV